MIASFPGSFSSKTKTAKTIVANPRGPNQPIKSLSATLVRVPTRHRIAPWSPHELVQSAPQRTSHSFEGMCGGKTLYLILIFQDPYLRLSRTILRLKLLVLGLELLVSLNLLIVGRLRYATRHQYAGHNQRCPLGPAWLRLAEWAWNA
jgi:hypothetical protein